MHDVFVVQVAMQRDGRVRRIQQFVRNVGGQRIGRIVRRGDAPEQRAETLVQGLQGRWCWSRLVQTRQHVGGHGHRSGVGQ
ncbi:MAG: hypothetical protein KBE90_01030 [Ottowia sp.]|nr:hypothetical protein [Ottowia sp.]